jgi:hypothetical protein
VYKRLHWAVIIVVAQSNWLPFFKKAKMGLDSDNELFKGWPTMTFNRTHFNKGKVSKLEAENNRLRRRVRQLERERTHLTEERNQYLHALLERFNKEGGEADWSDFNPADYPYTLEDIFAHLERKEKVCLPRALIAGQAYRRMCHGGTIVPHPPASG